MKKAIYKSPLYEIEINRAVFLNEHIIVYPNRAEDLPKNFDNVIKFLFGEGASVKEDITNGYPSFVITGANFELIKAHTINADWIYREVEVDVERHTNG